MPSLMNKMLTDKSIKELSQGLKKKDFSSLDIVNECYKQIEKLDSSINSCISVVDKEIALKKAKAVDNGQYKGSSILSGIPFVLKDAYVTKGIRTTAASNIFRNYIPQYD